MAKEKKANLSGVEVLLVIFSAFIGLVILSILTLKFVYPPEYFQIISKTVEITKTQIIKLSKIVGPFIIGLIFLFIGTIIEEKHKNNILTKVKEKNDVDDLVIKQLNPEDNNLFRIVDEEPNPKTEKEKENFTRKEKENAIKRKMENQLAEVEEEYLEIPYKKNFIPEFPNVYFYAEDDEIRVEEQNEDLLSKVQELEGIPETKTKIPEEKEKNIVEETAVPVPTEENKEELKKKLIFDNSSIDKIIDQIIDSFAEDMENLPLELENQNIEKFYDEAAEIKIESTKDEELFSEELVYPSLTLKPVESSTNHITAELTKEDLKIIGEDPQPKGIFFKNDLKKLYFTYEKYIKEELSSAKRLDYEICFFTIEPNKDILDKLTQDFSEGCECFVLKNKALFILPFYNKLEVSSIVDKYNLKYNIIGKENDYKKIKETLNI